MEGEVVVDEKRRFRIRFIRSLLRVLKHQFLTAEEWRERAKQRRALRELDDHLLKDIGLSRADVEHEASKPFWRE